MTIEARPEPHHHYYIKGASYTYAGLNPDLVSKPRFHYEDFVFEGRVYGHRESLVYMSREIYDKATGATMQIYSIIMRQLPHPIVRTWQGPALVVIGENNRCIVRYFEQKRTVMFDIGRVGAVARYGALLAVLERSELRFYSLHTQSCIARRGVNFPQCRLGLRFSPDGRLLYATLALLNITTHDPAIVVFQL